MSIHRYNEHSIVFSNLNRMEDILSWIRGLRSKGLAADILKEIHGFKTKRSIESRSIAINRHAEIAVNYLEQGLNGPLETSFLPIYYGMLNLSKIYIICSDQYSLLYRRKNRLHGATTKPLRGKYRNFLKDKVFLHPNGTIPIFYNVLTKQLITQSINIELNEIYPFIRDISHEYTSLYNSKSPLQYCELELIENVSDGHFIRLNFSGEINKHSNHKGRNHFLKNFTKVSANTFETNKITGDFGKVSLQLINEIPRSLIYEEIVLGNFGREIVGTYIPISGKRVLLPEELPILLAFFHLSYTVRYYPDILYEIKDSPEWGMLQTLSRHGTYKFLVLFWSYIQQKSFSIQTR